MWMIVSVAMAVFFLLVMCVTMTLFLFMLMFLLPLIWILPGLSWSFFINYSRSFINGLKWFLVINSIYGAHLLNFNSSLLWRVKRKPWLVLMSYMSHHLVCFRTSSIKIIADLRFFPFLLKIGGHYLIINLFYLRILYWFLRVHFQNGIFIYGGSGVQHRFEIKLHIISGLRSNSFLQWLIKSFITNVIIWENIWPIAAHHAFLGKLVLYLTFYQWRPWEIRTLERAINLRRHFIAWSWSHFLNLIRSALLER